MSTQETPFRSAPEKHTERGPSRFDEDVYAAVKKVASGKVATYGLIAAISGHPGAARAVGNALHRNPYPGIVPCHRVVSSQGCLAKHFGFGGSAVQRQLLEQEGVHVENDSVDLGEYLDQALLEE